MTSKPDDSCGSEEATTSSESSTDADGKRRSSQMALKVAIAASLAAMAIATWMYVGGLVTFEPGVTPTAIQNYYLARILWYGSAVVILEGVVLVILIRGMHCPPESTD